MKRISFSVLAIIFIAVFSPASPAFAGRVNWNVNVRIIDQGVAIGVNVGSGHGHGHGNYYGRGYYNNYAPVYYRPPIYYQPYYPPRVQYVPVPVPVPVCCTQQEEEYPYGQTREQYYRHRVEYRQNR